MHYVYVLQDRWTQQRYYGYTGNLKRRLMQHVKMHAWVLVYYEAYKAEDDARR